MQFSLKSLLIFANAAALVLVVIWYVPLLLAPVVCGVVFYLLSENDLPSYRRRFVKSFIRMGTAYLRSIAVLTILFFFTAFYNTLLMGTKIELCATVIVFGLIAFLCFWMAHKTRKTAGDYSKVMAVVDVGIVLVVFGLTLSFLGKPW